MDLSTSTIKSTIISFGLLLGAISVIFQLMLYFLDMHYKNDFISTLPGGGKRNGTLERRLKTEGNYVKAKTGGLSGVSNLSGYVFSPRYGPVAFSLLMSGYRGSSQPYRNLQDAIIKQLLYG